MITQSKVATPLAVVIAINGREITSITSLLSFGKANKNFMEITNKHFKQANTFKKIKVASIIGVIVHPNRAEAPK